VHNREGENTEDEEKKNGNEKKIKGENIRTKKIRDNEKLEKLYRKEKEDSGGTRGEGGEGEQDENERRLYKEGKGKKAHESEVQGDKRTKSLFSHDPFEFRKGNSATYFDMKTHR
jgi:hypothetical protein